MRRNHPIRLTLIAASLAALWCAAPARGAFIATETSSVRQTNPGTYLYSYTIAVSATSTVSASEFDLSLGGPIDVNSIISPSNFFTFYTPGDPFINFTAFDIGTSFLGIAPGSSGTFSFTSSYAPIAGSYSLQGLDPSFSLGVITGTAMTPGVVPEPASALLTGLGLVGLAGLSIRVGRRGRAAAG